MPTFDDLVTDNTLDRAGAPISVHLSPCALGRVSSGADIRFGAQNCRTLRWRSRAQTSTSGSLHARTRSALRQARD
eukprot:1535561-Rhodomonas_salina.5